MQSLVSILYQYHVAVVILGYVQIFHDISPLLSKCAKKKVLWVAWVFCVCVGFVSEASTSQVRRAFVHFRFVLLDLESMNVLIGNHASMIINAMSVPSNRDFPKKQMNAYSNVNGNISITLRSCSGSFVCERPVSNSVL